MARVEIESTPTMVAEVYRRLAERLGVVRARLDRPLSLAEKVLLGHLDDPAGEALAPGTGYIALRPDRVAMQDATAQMALLQFAQARRDRVAVPATVHCDHLIQARVGRVSDMEAALMSNREVFDFLRSASARYGIGFWPPGAGIIHQVVLEHYAFPGGLMLGTDSHTPNAGGLAMLAVGVGGADAVDVMAGLPWEVLHPKRVGVYLTGRLNDWVAPKDVILAVLGRLTVKGGTNRIVEYLGPGADEISATGKATITNMGAELGATTSVFPYDEHMDRYLRATDRTELADLARANLDLLRPDPEVEANPRAYFDELLQIDLSALEPHIVGPHTPDLARTISQLAAAVERERYPERLSAALLGSCTNSSYEDLTRAADVARQAARHGVKMPVPFLVTPGSEQIRATAERDGQLQAFEAVGATILANACGPCIGQWKRDEVINAATEPGTPATQTVKADRQPVNSILNSYNRNFPRRNDGNPSTLAFMGSPEIVLALGLAGRLTFNPLTDSLTGADGEPFKLEPPARAPELPKDGFAAGHSGYVSPPDDGSSVALRVDPRSERLQLLDPFPAWDGADFVGLPVLFKARGKCTTDHISPAGPWLRFRGHLDRISDNMLAGAVNAFNGEAGVTRNAQTGEAGRVSDVARAYRQRGQRWVVVGDENYGEGSSREHAAMSPRYLGAAAIIVRSFARIHESNLKKQGVLPLTFADSADYDKVREGDRVSLRDLARLTPGRPVRAVLEHADGSRDAIDLQHSLSEGQIAWFKAGSALNLIGTAGA